MQPLEPQWVARLDAKLASRSDIVLYRPWLSLAEQLRNPDLLDALAQPPRAAFYTAKQMLRLSDHLFQPITSAQAFLKEADGPNPLISAADKDLYCLLRADIMLVDLSVESFGEQGIDALFGFVGGMPVIGLTDRFQNAPSILSRLDCLIAPSSVEQIVHVIDAFGSNKAPQSSQVAPTEVRTNGETSTNDQAINEDWSRRVLATAGAMKEQDNRDANDQGSKIP